MNRRKGHNYLTVFSDLITKRLLFATPGEEASVWEAFAEELLRHNGHPKAIQHVAHRHERRLHQGSERLPRERSGGVR
jgi:transposase